VNHVDATSSISSVVVDAEVVDDREVVATFSFLSKNIPESSKHA
jgi:hypothetical protein